MHSNLTPAAFPLHPLTRSPSKDASTVHLPKSCSFCRMLLFLGEAGPLQGSQRPLIKQTMHPPSYQASPRYLSGNAGGVHSTSCMGRGHCRLFSSSHTCLCWGRCWCSTSCWLGVKLQVPLVSVGLPRLQNALRELGLMQIVRPHLQVAWPGQHCRRSKHISEQIGHAAFLVKGAFPKLVEYHAYQAANAYIIMKPVHPAKASPLEC